MFIENKSFMAYYFNKTDDNIELMDQFTENGQKIFAMYKFPDKSFLNTMTKKRIKIESLLLKPSKKQHE